MSHGKRRLLSGTYTDIACSSNNISNGGEHGSIPCKCQASISELVGALNNFINTFSNKIDCLINAVEKLHPSYSCSLMDTAPVEITPAFQAKAKSEKAIVDALCDLKNQRYVSVDKMLMNNCHAEVYTAGLSANEKKVPRKHCEKLLRHDTDAIKAVKIKQTIQNVEAEIEKLNIHKGVHENKVRKFDNKAEEIITSIEQETLRNKLQNGWSMLTSRNEQNLRKKWETKKAFVSSDNHMIRLGTPMSENSFPRPSFAQVAKVSNKSSSNINNTNNNYQVPFNRTSARPSSDSNGWQTKNYRRPNRPPKPR